MSNMMTQRPESGGSRWPRRILDLVGRSLFTGAAIALYVWISHHVETTQPALSAEQLSMRISHEQGAESKASRCGDCPQIGDKYTAVVWGGESSGATTAIYVYVNDRPVTSCEGCRALSFVVRDIGKYYVVAASRTQSCQVADTRSFDALMASFMRCGHVENQSFDVR
jgi:hypothetical protein